MHALERMMQELAIEGEAVVCNQHHRAMCGLVVKERKHALHSITLVGSALRHQQVLIDVVHGAVEL